MVYKRIRDLREDKDMTQTQISQIRIAAKEYTAITSVGMWTSPLLC